MQTPWHSTSGSLTGLLDDLLQDVCDVCGDGVTPEEIKGKSRKPDIVKARRVAIGVMRRMFCIDHTRDGEPEMLTWNVAQGRVNSWGGPISQPMIAYFFNCDSTAVLYHIRHAQDLAMVELIKAVVQRTIDRYPNMQAFSILMRPEPEPNLSLGEMNGTQAGLCDFRCHEGAVGAGVQDRHEET